MFQRHSPTEFFNKFIGELLWNYFFNGRGGLLEVGRELQRLASSRQLYAETLILTSRSAEVLTQPWEYLNYESGPHRIFLLRDYQVGLIRSLPWGNPRPPAIPPLKVLVCLSCPADRVGFNTLWCREVIEKEWAPLCGPYAEFHVEGLAPTPGTLLSGLENYDVVYFLGHGDIPPEAPVPSLVLCQQITESPTLASARLAAIELAAKLTDRRCRTKLLVLIACNSATIATSVLAPLGEGPGPELPTIVAMEFLCPVGTALHFHKVVFPGVLFGLEKTIAGALAKWRCRPDIARVMDTREHPVWGVPTVFGPPGEQANTLVRTTAHVASPGFSPTRGPIGLSSQQLQLVNRQMQQAGLPGSWTTRLQHAFNPTNGYIATSYQPDLPVEPFEIDIYPVTNHLYDYYRKHIHPEAPPRRIYDGEKPEHPAQVTYEAARLFCEKVSEYQQLQPKLRLPTRIQWERAARGASRTIFPWGDDFDPQTPDGRLRCNVWEAGLGSPGSVFAFDHGVRWNGVPVRDMIGNIPEWTQDENSLGRVAVMGAGYEFPLVANLPSYWRWVDPLQERYFAFRCVRPIRR